MWSRRSHSPVACDNDRAVMQQEVAAMNETVEQLPQISDSPPADRAQDLLLDFLRDHDAACPVCGYNLKTLTRPICPECGHELVLTVGTTRVRLGWLLAAVAP